MPRPASIAARAWRYAVGGEEGKGWKDTEKTTARFNAPQAVYVDGNNAILVADTNNQCLRMIAGGRVTMLAPRQSTEVVAGKHNAGELTKMTLRGSLQLLTMAMKDRTLRADG